MAVKLADTLAPMGDFEIAQAKDVSVEIGGTTKMLQTAIDNGEIGGGGSSTFVGTQAEWEALLPTEKAKYEFADFTDDVDGALIDDTEAHTNKVYSSSKVESELAKLSSDCVLLAHNTSVLSANSTITLNDSIANYRFILILASHNTNTDSFMSSFYYPTSYLRTHRENNAIALNAQTNYLNCGFLTDNVLTIRSLETYQVRYIYGIK